MPQGSRRLPNTTPTILFAAAVFIICGVFLALSTLPGSQPRVSLPTPSSASMSDLAPENNMTYATLVQQRDNHHETILTRPSQHISTGPPNVFTQTRSGRTVPTINAYTRTATGCPCFHLPKPMEIKACACCLKHAVQCGRIRMSRCAPPGKMGFCYRRAGSISS